MTQVFFRWTTKTLIRLSWCLAYTNPESLSGGGSNCDRFFFSWWDEGGSKYHYKWAIIGPPAKRHLNGVSLVCWWWPNIECWLGSFVIFRGSRPVLLRNPIFLWFFRVVRTPGPPLWIRTCLGWSGYNNNIGFLMSLLHCGVFRICCLIYNYFIRNQSCVIIAQ